MIRTNGFIPILDDLVEQIGNLYGAYVYGYIWLNRSREGVFDQPLDTVAARARLSRNTVIKWVKYLCINGYLEDLTPGERARPHQYTCTDKVDLDLTIAFEVSKSVHPGAQIYTPGESISRTPGVHQMDSRGVHLADPRGTPNGLRSPSRAPQESISRTHHHDDHDDDDHNNNIIIESAHLDANLYATLWRSIGLDKNGLDAILKHYDGRETELGDLLHAWAEAVGDKRLPTNWGPGLIYKKIFSGHKPPEKQKTFGDEVMELMRLKQAQLDAAKEGQADET